MGLFGFGNSNKSQIQMCAFKISTGLGQIEKEFQSSGGGVTPMIRGIASALQNEARTLEKLLKPIINFLFPNAGQNAKKYIAVNMSANILGMGNAATPMGIKAMQCLDKENNNPLYTSKNMCMLVVLNTTSVQLIPTTIIALRVAVGSANPFSVILPIWISSFTAAFIALTLTKLLYRE